jgi:hypothetical protein
MYAAALLLLRLLWMCCVTSPEHQVAPAKVEWSGGSSTLCPLATAQNCSQWFAALPG